MEFEDYIKTLGIEPDKLTPEGRATLQALFSDEDDQGDDNGDEQETEKRPMTARGQNPIEAAAGGYRPRGGDGASADNPVTQAYRRVQAIRAACGDRYPEICAQAIEAGWDVRSTLDVIAVRDRAASGGGQHQPGATAPHSAAVIEASMCLAGNLPNIDRHFDERTLEAAERRRGSIGLQSVLLDAAWANGLNQHDYPRWSDNVRTGGQILAAAGFRPPVFPAIQAAASMADISVILSNVSNKFSLEGFAAIDQNWRPLAKISQLNDFKPHYMVRLLGGGRFEKVGQDGQLKGSQIADESFTVQAATWGEIYTITRQEIRNDNLGMLTDIPKQIGIDAALRFNQEFWTTWLALNFFSTGNKNYLSGGSSALSITSLQSAVQLFREQTSTRADGSGQILAIPPKYLVVPAALESAALSLFKSDRLIYGGSGSNAKNPDANIYQGQFTPIVAPYLGTAIGLPSASDTAWYLTSDASSTLAAIQVGFLDGVQTPTVQQADADFGTLGIRMLGYWDFGIAAFDKRAAVKSAGA